MAQHKYTVTFDDGHSSRYDGADPRMEITYWTESNGTTSGEAYFRRDDFLTVIVAGQFTHPYSGLQYRLHVPSRTGKSTECVLDVLKWANVGRSEPKETT